MNNKDLLIENAVIADRPEDGAFNILVKQGSVEKISRDKIFNAGTVKIINANGNLISPGFIDLHVHFRDPGFTYKEDIISGSAAAAKGGYTSVLCMPNTNPCADNAEVVGDIKNRAETGAKCGVYPVGALTSGQKSECLTDFAELKKSGAIALSDDGRPVMTADMMLAALTEAKKNGMLVISHCEEMTLARGVMNEGTALDEYNGRHNTDYAGIPNSAEDIITARDLILADETRAKLHIAHISTAGSADLLALYKKCNAFISGETCPHYFALNDEAVLKYGVNAKMNPPLRNEKDRLAIIQAIKNGIIDCISTDHAPHSAEDKCETENDLKKAMNGITGLETAFAVSYTHLVRSGVITLSRLLELMCRNPARIAQIPKGGFKEGDIADYAIFNTERKFIFYRNNSYSKSRNTPFGGLELYGEILYTVAGGEITYENKNAGG